MDDNLFLQEKEHLLPNETLNKIPEKSDQTLRQQNFPILPTKLKINKFLIKRKISTKFNTKLIHSPNKQKVLSVNSNEVKTNKFIILKKEPHESVQKIESKEINLPLTKIEKLESKFITSPTIASNKTSNKTIKLILKSEKISKSDIKSSINEIIPKIINVSEKKNNTVNVNITKNKNNYNNTVNYYNKSFGQLLTEFFVNFFDQIKGKEGI